ncbi:MAG: response regulator transcription factor [Planctomycetota bacterium]|jgi:DNA-binding NarL/FixJ family response regulator
MLGESRLLIVTEHHLFRECLAAALVAADSSFVVGFADGYESARRQVEAAPPDAIIIDLHPPNGFSTLETRQLAQLTSAPILIVGQPKREQDIVAYLEAGAADYRISQNESVDDLRLAIRGALRGELACSAERISALIARLQELARYKSRLEDLDTSSLTRRELQVLRLVDEGRSNKQIAAELHLSLHTVKNHVHRILEKLNVRNRRQAVHYAYSEGWLK